MHDGTRRAIFAAFLANLGIAVSKFAAFAITGSASMLAESIHSVADTGNQGLLFLGGRRSRKAPTAEHPFGFGHERYFWAFVVALVLFSLGSLFALVEGVDKLRNPEHLDSPIVAYVVLGVAIVLEALSLRTARREALPMREGRSWWRFIHTTKNAEIPVVLLEDTGALVGLFIALVGITTAEITGDPRWDAAGSLGIGLLLGVIAVVLAIEMKSLLIGEAVAPGVRGADPRRDHRRPRGHAASSRCARCTSVPTTCSSRRNSSSPCDTMPALADAIDTVEARVRASVPIAKLIYVEPDIYRSRDRRKPVTDTEGT